MASLPGRAARATTPTNGVRLVLPIAGETPPSWNAGSSWRAVVPGVPDDRSPEDVLSRIRLSPLTTKGERVLLSALTDPDLGRLGELVDHGGELALPAAVAMSLRAAEAAPDRALSALAVVLPSDKEPWNHRALRKLLPDLMVCVVLAPGVKAILPLEASSLGMLQAELLNLQGRPLDAVSALEALPMSGAVGVGLAAAYLATGRSAAVVKLTDRLNNVDDLSALGFVARSVALRTLGRGEEALAALDLALASPARHQGVLAAALEERAAMLGAAGDDLAARADLERLQSLDGGAPLQLSRVVSSARPAVKESAEDAAAAMMEARARVRRQLRGTGVPGTFGGRHHSTYAREVQAILATEHLETGESLLLGLMDAVEDEAEELGCGIDGTYYLTLADLYAAFDHMREREAVVERYQSACARYGAVGLPLGDAVAGGASAEPVAPVAPVAPVVPVAEPVVENPPAAEAPLAVQPVAEAQMPAMHTAPDSLEGHEGEAAPATV